MEDSKRGTRKRIVRKPAEGRAERVDYSTSRSYGDSPRSGSDKPRHYGDKPRSYGDKPRSFGDKPRTFGDKPAYGDRPARAVMENRPSARQNQAASLSQSTMRPTRG